MTCHKRVLTEFIIELVSKRLLCSMTCQNLYTWGFIIELVSKRLLCSMTCHERVHTEVLTDVNDLLVVVVVVVVVEREDICCYQDPKPLTQAYF